MKEGDKVVCIRKDKDNREGIHCPAVLKEGEIYTFHSLRGSFPDGDYWRIKEHLTWNGYSLSFREDLFRPVDDTFGEATADRLELLFEIKEMEQDWEQIEREFRDL